MWGQWWNHIGVKEFSEVMDHGLYCNIICCILELAMSRKPNPIMITLLAFSRNDNKVFAFHR